MDLRVVLVLMVQTPPSSDTSMTGVETVAAFRSRKFTSRACSYQELQELIRFGSKYIAFGSGFRPILDPDLGPIWIRIRVQIRIRIRVQIRIQNYTINFERKIQNI